MRCPKCGFTSFPYLENCGKCGQGLAEQRAALGVYALRPDPPDLRLAYQQAPMAGEASQADSAQAATGIDIAGLQEIDLGPVVVDEPVSALSLGVFVPEETVDLLPPTVSESVPGLEAHGLDSEVEPMAVHEDASAPVFDLDELDEMTLELETPGPLRDASIQSLRPPIEAPQVPSIYDLDTDTDDVTLGSEVDAAESIEAPHEALEYVLEVDDEIEVEFEVDELEIAEGDELESEEEDDNER